MTRLRLAVKRIQRVLDQTELSEGSFARSLLVFLVIVVLRVALARYEGAMSKGGGDVVQLESAWFFGLTYFSIAASIILVFHVLARKPLAISVRQLVPLFWIGLLGPTVEICLGYSAALGVGWSAEEVGFWDAYAGLFVMGRSEGIGLGQRIELGVAVASAIAYLSLCRSSLWKIVAGAWAVYTIIFLHTSFSVWFLHLSELLGLLPAPELRETALLFVTLWISLVVLLGALIVSPQEVARLVRSFGWLRFAHYALTFLVGAAFTFRERLFTRSWDVLLALVLVLLAVFLGQVFAMAVELKDRVNRTLTWGMLVFAIHIAVVVSFDSFFVIVLFVGNCFIYSMKPLRLVMFPVVCKFLFAVNTLALLLLGYLEAGGNLETFPRSVFAFVLVGITLASNFEDLAIVNGRNDVATLPGLIGRQPAQILLGTVFLVFYCLVSLLIRVPQDWSLPAWWSLIPAAAIGILQFALINRRSFRAEPIMVVHLLSLALFGAYVLIAAPRDVLKVLL